MLIFWHVSGVKPLHPEGAGKSNADAHFRTALRDFQRVNRLHLSFGVDLQFELLFQQWPQHEPRVVLGGAGIGLGGCIEVDGVEPVRPLDVVVGDVVRGSYKAAERVVMDDQPAVLELARRLIERGIDLH